MHASQLISVFDRQSDELSANERASSHQDSMANGQDLYWMLVISLSLTIILGQSRIL
jgi:hypothetical protein